MSSSESAPLVDATAVATVSYGSEDVLPRFLDSIPHSSASRLAVVVADNQPKDNKGVAEIARSRGVKYLPMVGNLGYGGALNVAIDSLDPQIEWILLSNPDVELSDNSVDILLATGVTDRSIAAVGPRVLTLQGDTYPSARSIPSLRTGIGHALFANVWKGNPWTRSYRNDADHSPVARDTGWLSGSCLLVRRSAFVQIGGFDTGYFMYFEDVDLGYRFGRAGFRNVYEPNALVTHIGAHSTNEDSARMIAAHHASARRFLNRKYSGWMLLPVRVVLTIGLSIRSAALSRNPGHH